MHSMHIKNLPINLNFTGLMGNTFDMQNQGWEFSFNHDRSHRGYMYQIAGRHRGMNLRLISAQFHIDIGKSMVEYLRQLIVPVRACSERVDIILNEMPKFNGVDFNDRTVIDLGRTTYSLDDILPFSPTESEAEIYIPEKEIWTVEKHFQAIKEAQKDKQKELREKKRKSLYEGSSIMGESTPQIKLKLISV